MGRLRAAGIALALGSILATNLWSSVQGLPPPARPSGSVSAEETPGTRWRRGGPIVAHHPGGIPAAGGVPRRARAQRVDLGHAAIEPTLAITSDGTIFFPLIAGPLVEEQPLMRSTDGGRSWEVLIPHFGTPQANSGSADPILTFDRTTDRIFRADASRVPGCWSLGYSDDGGEHWDGGRHCGPHADHETVFVGPPSVSAPDGYPNVVYYCSISGGYGAKASVATMCSRSIDGGDTFVPTGDPAFADHLRLDGAACSGASGHGTVGVDGTIAIARGWCDQPWVALSRDEGRTWVRRQVASNSMALTPWGDHDHEASVAIDPDGVIYVAWVARDRLPYLSWSSDAGETWRRPVMVGPPGLTEANLVSVDVGRPGAVAIGFMGTTEGPAPPFNEGPPCPGAPSACRPSVFGSQGVPPEYAGVRWNGYVTTIADVRQRRPILLTATVNHPNEPLLVGDCGPGRCHAVLDFIDVLIGPRGRPWVGLVDDCAVGSCADFEGVGVLGRVVGIPSLR